MSADVTYQKVARVLACWIDHPDHLLDATDSVVGMLLTAGASAAARAAHPSTGGPAPAPLGKEHLDAAGLASEVVMARLIEGKLIFAIKELREITGAGLKDCKETVERLQVLPVVRAAQAALWNVRVDLGT